MNDKANDIDELIGKYLSGEASPEEIQSVELWISSSESNKKYFEQLQTIFIRSAAAAGQREFDVDAAWRKMQSRLEDHSDPKVVRMETRGTTSGLWWKIAASIIICLGIGYAFYFSTRSGGEVEVVAKDEVKTDTLPDGTSIFLNKTSQLAYAFDKKKNEHVVKLKGEAYFNVQHDDEKSFVIAIDSVYIRDIGTSFNVKAYPASNTIEVVVEEGAIQFYNSLDSVFIQASEKAVYNKLTRTFSVEKPQPNETAYKSKSFVFSDVELRTVVGDLNAVYDEKIFLGQNVMGCRLTVNFENDNIEDIASVIAETLNLSVSKTEGGFLIDGPSCNE